MLFMTQSNMTYNPTLHMWFWLYIFNFSNELPKLKEYFNTIMPRCLQSMASHFAPAGWIEPVVIVLAGVSILLGQTLKPEEERTSNNVLIKGWRVEQKRASIKHISFWVFIASMFECVISQLYTLLISIHSTHVYVNIIWQRTCVLLYLKVSQMNLDWEEQPTACSYEYTVTCLQIFG